MFLDSPLNLGMFLKIFLHSTTTWFMVYYNLSWISWFYKSGNGAQDGDGYNREEVGSSFVASYLVIIILYACHASAFADIVFLAELYVISTK